MLCTASQRKDVITMMMSFKDCVLLILFAALYFYEIRRPLEDADGEKFYEKMR